MYIDLRLIMFIYIYKTRWYIYVVRLIACIYIYICALFSFFFLRLILPVSIVFFVRDLFKLLLCDLLWKRDSRGSWHADKIFFIPRRKIDVREDFFLGGGQTDLPRARIRASLRRFHLGLVLSYYEKTLFVPQTDIIKYVENLLIPLAFLFLRRPSHNQIYKQSNI